MFDVCFRRLPRFVSTFVLGVFLLMNLFANPAFAESRKEAEARVAAEKKDKDGDKKKPKDSKAEPAPLNTATVNDTVNDVSASVPLPQFDDSREATETDPVRKELLIRIRQVKTDRLSAEELAEFVKDVTGRADRVEAKLANIEKNDDLRTELLQAYHEAWVRQKVAEKYLQDAMKEYYEKYPKKKIETPPVQPPAGSESENKTTNKPPTIG